MKSHKKGPTLVRPHACGSCIFGPRNTRVELRPGGIAEIQEYLIKGTPHLCHSEDAKGKRDTFACRGGRNYQLTIWHRMGIIAKPTDEALAEAMAAAERNTK